MGSRRDGGYVSAYVVRPVTRTPAPSAVDYLVVAGGGSGGGIVAGGGGAGGLRSTVTATGGGGTLETSATVASGTTYTITVGAGACWCFRFCYK
jgi:hypothetical protein